MSVRFLGRRVYLALLFVLKSDRRAAPTSAQTHLAGLLAVPLRTLQRWRSWWTERFPFTLLWQSACARFMPPVPAHDLPASLLARFTASPAESMTRFLAFLTPLTVRQ